MAPMLVCMFIFLTFPGFGADEATGIYKVERASGTVIVQGKPYDFAWGWSGWFTPGPPISRSFPFPPGEILAAVLGDNIVVKGKRIQVNPRAREDIVKLIRRDPRLSEVMFFSIKSPPRFVRFKRSDDGVLRARSWSPLFMEVAVTYGNGSIVNVRANYQARIVGENLVVKVTFLGGGEDVHDDSEYDVSGFARIIARRK